MVEKFFLSFSLLINRVIKFFIKNKIKYFILKEKIIKIISQPKSKMV